MNSFLGASATNSFLAPPGAANIVGFSFVNRERPYTYPAGNFEIRVINPNDNYVKTTSAGVISIGMSMLMRLLYPDSQDYPHIILAPHGSWIGKDGTNLMQIYFSIACNFFIHKRKTTIVCRPDQKDRIIKYLRLGNPYNLPNPTGYLGEELIKRFRREAIYLADRASIDGVTRMADPYPDMIEFKFLSETGGAKIDNVTIQDKGDGSFMIDDSGVKHILQGENNTEIELEFSEHTKVSEIPEFGVTFLGTSGGMDPNGLTSNQIIWAGDRHLLVDVGASTLPALNALGLSPKDITDVVITHMHEDHVVGLLAYLEWCKKNDHHIRLLIEPGIYDHVKNQLKQVLENDLDNVYDIEFVPLKFYERLTLGTGINSVLIEPIPAFHGTPTAMLRVTYKDKTISHSSDQTFDPIRFQKILDYQVPPHIKDDLRSLADMDPDNTRVFDEDRVDEFSTVLFAPNDAGNSPSLIIHEAGNGAQLEENTSNHTTPFALQLLPEEVQRVMYVNHTAKLPEGTKFLFNHACPLHTVSIIPQSVTTTVQRPSRNAERMTGQSI